MKVERRRFRRKNLTIKVNKRDSDEQFWAQDIGEGGMLLQSKAPKWPGELIRLRFQLKAQTKPIAATCRVVELLESPRGVGLSVEFLKLAPDAAQMIKNFTRPDYLRVIRRSTVI